MSVLVSAVTVMRTVVVAIMAVVEAATLVDVVLITAQAAPHVILGWLLIKRLALD